MGVEIYAQLSRAWDQCSSIGSWFRESADIVPSQEHSSKDSLSAADDDISISFFVDQLQWVLKAFQEKKFDAHECQGKVRTYLKDAQKKKQQTSNDEDLKAIKSIIQCQQLVIEMFEEEEYDDRLVEYVEAVVAQESVQDKVIVLEDYFTSRRKFYSSVTPPETSAEIDSSSLFDKHVISEYIPSMGNCHLAKVSPNFSDSEDDVDAGSEIWV